MTDSSNKSVGSDLLLTNPEAAMQSFFQYNTRDFMQAIAHEAKQQIFVAEQYMKVLLNDPEFANEQVKSLWGQHKFEENGVVIMKELAKLRQLMEITWEYSESQLPKDTSNFEA